jgi:hypothetical protein
VGAKNRGATVCTWFMARYCSLEDRRNQEKKKRCCGPTIVAIMSGQIQFSHKHRHFFSRIGFAKNDGNLDLD